MQYRAKISLAIAGFLLVSSISLAQTSGDPTPTALRDAQNALRTSLAEIDAGVRAKLTDMNSKIDKIPKIEQDVAVLRSEVAEKEREIRSLRTTIDDIKEKNAGLRERLSTLEAWKAEAVARIAALEQRPAAYPINEESIINRAYEKTLAEIRTWRITRSVSK